MYHFPWITFSKAQLKTLISDHRILHISRKLRPVMYFFWFSPCWPILPFLSKKNFLVWGGKNVLCSRCEREFPFPVIPGNASLKFLFPWHFIISLPVPGKRKFWLGIRTGNTIIIPVKRECDVWISLPVRGSQMPFPLTRVNQDHLQSVVQFALDRTEPTIWQEILQSVSSSTGTENLYIGVQCTLTVNIIGHQCSDCSLNSVWKLKKTHKYTSHLSHVSPLQPIWDHNYLVPFRHLPTNRPFPYFLPWIFSKTSHWEISYQILLPLQFWFSEMVLSWFHKTKPRGPFSHAMDSSVQFSMNVNIWQQTFIKHEFLNEKSFMNIPKSKELKATLAFHCFLSSLVLQNNLSTSNGTVFHKDERSRDGTVANIVLFSSFQ